MSTELDGLLWPMERQAEAFEALATRLDWSPAVPSSALRADTFEARALQRGLQVLHVSITFRELPALFSGGPSLVQVRRHGVDHLLVIAGHRGRRVELIAPDGELVRALGSKLAAALSGTASRPPFINAEAVAGALQLSPRRARAYTDYFYREIAFDAVAASAWLVRLPPSAPLLSQFRASGGAMRLVQVLLLQALVTALAIVPTFALGLSVLKGNTDVALLWPWGLALGISVPAQALSFWVQQRVMLDAAVILRRRLLEGALRANVDELRKAGIGTYMGKVIEMSGIEYVSFSLLLGLLVGFYTAVAAAVLFAATPFPLWYIGLFVLATVATLLVAWKTISASLESAHLRIALSRDLVEKTLGHVTRAVQQAPAIWHKDEDVLLASYMRSAKHRDFWLTLAAVMPQVWSVAGVLAVAPLFFFSADPLGIVAAVSGVILGTRAIASLGGAAGALQRAVVAANECAPLARAGATQEVPQVASEPERVATNEVVVELAEATVTYPGSARNALQRASCRIRANDRILIVGPSGGGKSTLLSVLAGTRRPTSGLVLLNGFDQRSVSPERARKTVAFAPQFHENFVFSNSLAFNVLLGTSWPALPNEQALAERICRELGLGPLIDRMPKGMEQRVGELGWSLSHGERSRVFAARALLQSARVVLLDESFGALDPETLCECLDYLLKQEGARVMVAHA